MQFFLAQDLKSMFAFWAIELSFSLEQSTTYSRICCMHSWARFLVCSNLLFLVARLLDVAQYEDSKSGIKMEFIPVTSTRNVVMQKRKTAFNCFKRENHVSLRNSFMIDGCANNFQHYGIFFYSFGFYLHNYALYFYFYFTSNNCLAQISFDLTLHRNLSFLHVFIICVHFFLLSIFMPIPLTMKQCNSFKITTAFRNK